MAGLVDLPMDAHYFLDGRLPASGIVQVGRKAFLWYTPLELRCDDRRGNDKDRGSKG
jgi:hypothetical protein